MKQLSIHLLGTLAVSVDGGPTLDLGSPTTKSLFAYLVLHRDAPVDRRRLSFIFWPRGTEAAARRSLRQYLHRLRRILDPIDPQGGMIAAEGNTICFTPPLDWYLDVNAFEAAVQSNDTLEQAVELYRGDLLPEIYEDWIDPQRERLSRLYRQCLLRLMDRLETEGQLSLALHYARLYLEQEPLLESAHLRAMRLYYALGDRLKVKAQYEALTALLRQELDAGPLPETTMAYEAMLAGEYDLSATTLQPAPPRQASVHGPSARVEAVQPRLIGRDGELARLDRAFSRVATSQGGMVVIEGESGIGKTRLITDWLGRIQTPTYLFAGRGHEFEQMLSYAPLADAIRQGIKSQVILWDLFRPVPPWMVALHSLLPELQTRLPELSALVPGMGAQYHVIEGVGHFLLTLAHHRPVVLFLDNLHWADPPTWNFIGYLSQYVPQAALLVVIAIRPEDLPAERWPLIRNLQGRGSLQEVKLERLSEAETQQLITELLADDPVDQRFVRRIYQETEGNPFFIIETIRAVRDAGGEWTRSLPTDEQGQRPFMAIPLEVQAVIQSRLDRLSEESRLALGVAAAIGREFSFELLREVSQMDTQFLLDALDEWLARNIVRETSEGYDFTHEKLGQVAYQQLTRARRQWFHLRIAEYLERSGPDVDPAKLAHHYYLSGEPGRALPYLIQAGERALSVRSYADARELGLRAIGLLGRHPATPQAQKADRLELSLQMAQAYAYTGGLTRSLEMLQEAERLAESLGDVRHLARIFQRSARIFWLRGYVHMAADYARRTLRHAEELDDSALRFAALRMLGRVSILQAQYDNAIAYLLRYLDLAEHEFAPPDVPVIYGYLGVAYARVGSWQRAIDAAQKGLELGNADQPGATHVVARMQLAFVYAELREWQEALAVAHSVRDVWKMDGMAPHLFMLRAVIGRSLVHTGRVQEGLAEIEEALAWAAEVDYRVLVHLPHLFLASCLYEAGEYLKGLQTATHVAETSADLGDRWAEAVALRVQAEIGMRLPRPNWLEVENRLIRARDALRQIRARPDLARTYLALRRLYDRAGQSAWAVDCHFRATTIFDELGMSDELRGAQGQPAPSATRAVVIPDLGLRGPNEPSVDAERG